MYFALSDEQQMLQASALRFFSERHPVARARAALPWSDDRQRGLWRDMAGMGWLGLLAPEDRGGLDLGMCEVFLVAEAAGRQLLNLPFAASVVLLPLLLRASGGSTGRLAQWVDGVVAGSTAVNVRFEGMSTLDHDRQCSHQVVLRGLAPADAQCGAGAGADASLAEWPPDTTAAPGLASGLDPTLRSRCVRSDNASTEPCAELAWEFLAIPSGERAFVLACYRMARIGELLGAASASLEASCDYARVREQFGKPIGSYQAIKHHASNAWMALDNARLAALYAVAALDSRLADWPFACAAAELTAIEAGMQIGRAAIQIHGGLGFTWEHHAHLYLKRIHHVSALLGGSEAACRYLEHAI